MMTACPAMEERGRRSHSAENASAASMLRPARYSSVRAYRRARSESFAANGAFVPRRSAASASCSGAMLKRLHSVMNESHRSAKPARADTPPNAVRRFTSSSAVFRMTILRPWRERNTVRSPVSRSTRRASEVNEKTDACSRPPGRAAASSRSVSKVNCSGTMSATVSPRAQSSATRCRIKRLFPLPARPARNVTGAAIRSAPGAADYKPLCLPDARFQTA